MKISQVRYILYIIVVMNFVSCKTSKYIINKVNLESLSANEIISKTNTINKIADTYSIKYNAKVKFLNKKQVLSGIIRIKTDSIIWISIGPSVGIELLRIVATKDSLKYINKTNNTYYLGTYDYLKNLTKLNFNYKVLESIFISKLFIYNSENSLNKEYQFSNIDSNFYVLRNYKEKIRDYLKTEVNNPYQQKIFLDPETFLIKKIIIKDKEVNRNLILDYDSYQNIDIYSIPEELNFNFDDINNLIQLSIKYQKVTVNKQLKFPFRINKKFTSI